jgi:hypothetical protein
MPWQGSDLWVAELDAAGARPGAPRRRRRERVDLPAEWSPAGELHFASDRSGWWNLHRERAGRIEPLHAMAAEFGEPQWEFGLSMYGFAGDGAIVCLYEQGGRSHLGRIDAGGRFAEIATPYCSLRQLQVDAGAGSPRASPPPSAKARRWCASTSRADVRGAAPRERARARPGRPLDRRADRVPDRGRPHRARLLLRAAQRRLRRRAGNAAAAARDQPRRPDRRDQPALGPKLQYWTQRGFAVVDVNYGGSSGYGAPTASGSTAAGASSTSTTSSTRRASSSRAATSTRSGSRSAAPARAATRRSPR